MDVMQMKLGPMDNFSYVIWEPGKTGAAVIDPAWQPEVIEKFLSKENLTIKFLLLTHAHPDHTNAARYFLDKHPGLTLTLHKSDTFLLDDGLAPITLLEGEETLDPDGLGIKVIHTPGHTPGSVCYLAGTSVFTGDTLFVGECGRADLPGSDPKALRTSLLKLSGLKDDTAIYPGHSYNGDTSTIGVQKEYNIYMKLAARSEVEFLKAAL